MQNLGNIDNQYTILSRLPTTFNDRKYYLVRNNQNLTIFIAIVKNDNNDFPANEINILNMLHNINNPYILRFVSHGNGQLILQNRPPRKAAYLIFENARFPDLFSYIAYYNNNNNNGFQERQAKLIFKKILLGVQAIHNANICLRNINIANILFDENYNPKLYAFELSSLNANNLTEFAGTMSYTAPEIGFVPYNGIKSDIFSLGQLLFFLVTGRLGFNQARNNDNLYHLIRTHQYDNYWLNININNLSNNFKNLFLRMVSPNPNGRPNIENILDDPWIQDINNLNPQEMNELENEVRQELFNRNQVVMFHHNLQIANDFGENENDI